MHCGHLGCTLPCLTAAASAVAHACAGCQPRQARREAAIGNTARPQQRRDRQLARGVLADEDEEEDVQVDGGPDAARLDDRRDAR